jgi:hypothetical protein
MKGRKRLFCPFIFNSYKINKGERNNAKDGVVNFVTKNFSAANAVRKKYFLLLTAAFYGINSCHSLVRLETNTAFN